MVQSKSQLLEDVRCLLRTNIEKECFLEIEFVPVSKAGL